MPRTHSHTNGGTQSRTYRSWGAMKCRCLSPTSPKYPRYGGRGITVCERWLRFENFLADMGLRPEGTTLDRIDVNGNYEPENCRWATPKEQQNNTRYTVRYEHNGENLTLSEWADRTGLPYETIGTRLRRGWTMDEALSVPILPNGTSRKGPCGVKPQLATKAQRRVLVNTLRRLVTAVQSNPTSTGAALRDAERVLERER